MDNAHGSTLASDVIANSAKDRELRLTLKHMKKLNTTNLSEFWIPLAILILSAVYIWTALPDLSNSLRFVITVIAIVLALILAYFVQHESNQTIETQTTA